MPKNKCIYRMFRSKAEFEAFKAQIAHFHRTLMMDFVTIALGRMGWGEKRLKDFDTVLAEVVDDYMDLFKEDLADDKEMVYSRAKLEEELKEHCGKFYAPEEERYGM